jgi:alpha-galactosidase
MAIKVAIIGAGSVGFTREITRDILCVPELQDTEFAFTDINQRNLEMVYGLFTRDVQAAGLPAKVTATLDRRAALEGADYVFSFVRVGGLEAWANDIDIPLQYGVDQAIGDTLAPGGIMYAQRMIPALLDFCKDIREVAAPDCLFMNYANPMAMNTWALNAYGGVKVLGLCHGVYWGQQLIARVLGVPADELDIICAGINHQSWFTSIKHRGRELTGELLAAFARDAEAMRTEKVRIDMLRRFGYFSTESNGHLSEYLPWYRKRPEEVNAWIDLGSWINGETGGALRVCTESRNWFAYDYPNWLREEPWTFRPEDRGIEHGSYIIEALETGRVYRGYFNVPNQGVITNLPGDAIVEVPGYIDGNGINIPVVGDLPMGCAAVCSNSINVQRLAVEAAVHGDDQLLRQAMLLDPLTGAVCTPPEVWQMVDALLVADAAWLPQYGPAIAKARARVAGGNLLPTRATRGVARLGIKSVEEMARDRELAIKQTVSASRAADA